MRETTTPAYLAAFDECRDRYLAMPTLYRSALEAMRCGFTAGVAYGRTHPAELEPQR